MKTNLWFLAIVLFHFLTWTLVPYQLQYKINDVTEPKNKINDVKLSQK